MIRYMIEVMQPRSFVAARVNIEKKTWDYWLSTETAGNLPMFGDMNVPMEAALFEKIGEADAVADLMGLSEQVFDWRVVTLDTRLIWGR